MKIGREEERCKSLRIVSHVNNRTNSCTPVFRHYDVFFVVITTDEERRRESCGDHWRVSSRDVSMSMKSHFDCRSEQWHAASQSRINRRIHFSFVWRITMNSEYHARSITLYADNVFPRCTFSFFRYSTIHVIYRKRDRHIFVGCIPVTALQTTKGKTRAKIDIRRSPDISAEKCSPCG